MHTYVIFEPDSTLRDQAIRQYVEKLHISPFDCITPTGEGPSIGIAETRLFIRALSLSPHVGAYTAGIITNAHTLTPEAQQSLLKTLEEPPLHAYIFLGAQNEQQLLPTIRSRSITMSHAGTIFQQNEEELASVKHLLTDILNASFGEKIRLVQTIGKSKEDIDHWIELSIHILRNDLIDMDTPKEEQHKKLSLLHHLFQTKKYLSNNVQPLLLVECAVLNVS